MTKERYQNPTVGDDLYLRLFAFNANAPKDLSYIDKVEIYFLDPTEVSETNRDGRILIKNIDGDDVTKTRTGEYAVSINIESDVFVIGQYLDVWHVTMQDNAPLSTITQRWNVYPTLWFTTPAPLAYDFSFDFRPNRIRKGPRRYLIINVTPNVPTAPDLEKYYASLIIMAPLKIYIEMACGPCMPEEEDLRLIVDGEEVLYRERNDAFYQIDTEDMDVGIYNIWFEMELGDNLYISEKQQLQIF